MRRKVIQDFANVFCQRLLDLPEGYDLASFAHFGSGAYNANVLTGECSFNHTQIPSLHLCSVYSAWLREQSQKHNIPFVQIRAATVSIQVKVENASVRDSFGHRFAEAHFFLQCRSEISTDEKEYTARMEGDKEWGFGWYYERLYGEIPARLPALADTWR